MLSKTLARDIRSYWVGVQGVYVPRSLETIPWPPGTYRRFHLGVEHTRPVYSAEELKSAKNGRCSGRSRLTRVLYFA